MESSKFHQDGLVLFDAGCGFCSRWIPWWQGSLAAAGLGIAALQDPAIRERLALVEEDLLRDILILFDDGRLIHGADVYRYVTRRFWWSYPVYLFSVLPGGRQIFDAGYRSFALHRYRISSACGLSPR